MADGTAIELVETTVYDWHELSDQQRAEIRFAVKAETAQSLRRLPMMIAAKVAIEIIADSIGTTRPRTAMSAVGSLCSDLAVETLGVIERTARSRGSHG